MSSETASGEGTFLRQANLLESLATFGYGLVDDFPADAALELSTPLVSFMRSPEGRAEVKEWAELFRRTLAELAAMRNLVVHRPEQVSLSDLQEGLLAEDRALEGFKAWLGALSQPPPPASQTASVA